MTVTVTQCREDLERLLRVLEDNEGVIAEWSPYDAEQFAHIVRRGIEAIDVQRMSTLRLRAELKSTKAEMAEDEKLQENYRLQRELEGCQWKLQIAEQNLSALQRSDMALRAELARERSRPKVSGTHGGAAYAHENASLRETIKEMRADYYAQIEQIRALTERVHAYEGTRHVHHEYFVPGGGSSLINPVAAPRRGKQSIGQGCTRAVPLRVRT